MFKKYFEFIIRALTSNSQEEAIDLCKEAVTILQKHSFAYILLIIFHLKKNDIKTAQYYCDELKKYNPNFDFQASKNIEIPLSAFILKHLIDIKTPFIETQYEKIVLENPNSPEAYINAGIAYLLNNDINNANRHIDDGLNMFSDNISLLYNKSAILMRTEKLEEAWKFYETRELIHKQHKPILDNVEKFAFQKEDINLLVYSSAGFGDTIFYSRYLELLKQKNIKLFIYVQTPLRKLYKELGYNVVEDLSSQKFDYQISFMSLGSLFETSLDTIPFSDGYIKISKNEKVFKDVNAKKVGLVWRSGAKNNRSLELEKLAEIAKINNIKCYSLQKDITQEEKKILEENNIVNLSNELTDFEKTACFINEFDLVIGCDTAVTNLSGAMGVETYVLAPYFCDFRWGVSEFWTPWYDSVKIFRQVIQDDWQKPLENLIKYFKKDE